MTEVGSHIHTNQYMKYRETSNIRRTKFQKLNVSRFVLLLALPNPLIPGVKLRMKMSMEQRQKAMLQLHLSDQRI